MLRTSVNMIHFLLIALSALNTAFAAPATKPAINVAHTMAAFKELGFKCTTFAPGSGMTCIGSFSPATYPRPVAFIVPPNFKPAVQTELVLHLHGWVQPATQLPAVLETFDLPRQFAASKRNAILVVPSSAGKCETFREWLMPYEGFATLLSAITNTLEKTGIGLSQSLSSVALTSHSGSYSTVAEIIEHHFDRIDEVFLFDALYGASEKFAHLADSRSQKKLLSIFVPSRDRGRQLTLTAKGNFELWEIFNPYGGTEEFLASTLGPWSNGSTIRAALKKSAFVQMRSGYDHNRTVRAYFARVLRR